MKTISVKCTIRYFFYITIISITITHYLEYYQTLLLLPIRNLIYFGSFSDVLIKNGVTQKRYKDLTQPQINPVTLANQVVSSVDIVLNNKSKFEQFTNYKDLTNTQKDDIINTAKFFIKYGEIRRLNDIEYFLLPYKFDLHSYDQIFKAPWYSGMAQGNAIKTMLAALLLTNDTTYLDYAKLLANALRIPINEGGVSTFIDSQKIWFEEYASPDVLPPFVLNGHNFALIGLHEIIDFDSSYQDLFDKGIAALITKLPEFNAIVWSRYDIIKYMANPKYHQIHIDQLKYLGKLINNNLLLKYAHIFQLQKIIPLGIYYRLLFYPHKFLVSITCFNIIIVTMLTLIIKNFSRIKKRLSNNKYANG